MVNNDCMNHSISVITNIVDEVVFLLTIQHNLNVLCFGYKLNLQLAHSLFITTGMHIAKYEMQVNTPSPFVRLRGCTNLHKHKVILL